MSYPLFSLLSKYVVRINSIRLSESDDLVEALVDLTPVLAEVNGAEAEDVVTRGVVLVGDIDVCLGIDHDAFRL